MLAVLLRDAGLEAGLVAKVERAETVSYGMKILTISSRHLTLSWLLAAILASKLATRTRGCTEKADPSRKSTQPRSDYRYAK